MKLNAPSLLNNKKMKIDNTYSFGQSYIIDWEQPSTDEWKRHDTDKWRFYFNIEQDEYTAQIGASLSVFYFSPRNKRVGLLDKNRIYFNLQVIEKQTLNK